MLTVAVYHNRHNDTGEVSLDYDISHEIVKVFEFSTPDIVQLDINSFIERFTRDLVHLEGSFALLYTRLRLRPLARGDLIHMKMGKWIDIWFDYTGVGWNIKAPLKPIIVDRFGEPEDILLGSGE